MASCRGAGESRSPVRRAASLPTLLLLWCPGSHPAPRGLAQQQSPQKSAPLVAWPLATSKQISALTFLTSLCSGFKTGTNPGGTAGMLQAPLISPLTRQPPAASSAGARLWQHGAKAGGWRAAFLQGSATASLVPVPPRARRAACRQGQRRPATEGTWGRGRAQALALRCERVGTSPGFGSFPRRALGWAGCRRAGAVGGCLTGETKKPGMQFGGEKAACGGNMRTGKAAKAASETCSNGFNTAICLHPGGSLELAVSAGSKPSSC